MLPTPAPDSLVLVTGASSGIGEFLARGLAERGHNLALTARRTELLEDLATELTSEHRVEVSVHPADLGDASARRELVADLLEEDRVVVGVCNNAGFGTSGRFVDLDVDRELDEVELNAAAVLHLTHAFAGPMAARGEGAILNVASVAAFQPLPSLATYAATKAFVQTFSEAVHTELQGSGVSCTVLCPGPVRTDWADIAGAQHVMVAPMSPRDVAEAGIAGMEQGKRSVVPGAIPKAMAIGGRFTARSVLLPAMRIYRRGLR